MSISLQHRFLRKDDSDAYKLDSRLKTLKRSTQELKKSEERFRAVLGNLSVGVYRFTPDGTILDANSKFINMLGFSSIEELALHGFEGQNFRTNLSLKQIKDSIGPDGMIKGVESVWNKRDSTQIYVLETITAVLNREGNVLYYEGIAEDITDRRAEQKKMKEDIFYLEKKINRRTAQLMNANDALRKEISEKRQKGKELRNSNIQLRALTNHLESVREEERAKISREVHDGLGQSMVCLKIDIQSLRKEINEMVDKTQAENINETIKKMSALIDSNIQSVRRIAMELRPDVLDDLGTVAAIEWQTEDYEKLTGIKCVFNSELEDMPLDRESSTAIFRIFQETLTNISRHADATIVRVNIKKRRNKYVLEVHDNGIGITTKEISARQSLGLLGMKERALLIGGNVKIVGKENKGTKITVSIPIAKDGNDKGTNS